MDPESNQMEQQQVQTVLCRNNCGFYGNVATESMCSVCYRSVVLKQQQASTGMPASLAAAPASGTIASLSIDECSSSSSTSSSSPARPMLATLDTATTTTVLAEKRSASDLSTLGASASAASLASSSSSCSFQNLDVSDDDPSLKDGKKKKNRCLSCKKKVGLTGFTCRCGGLFCSIHRYSDKHDCNFDYKELGAEEIRKSNPVVVAKKVQKI